VTPSQTIKIAVTDNFDWIAEVCQILDKRDAAFNINRTASFADPDSLTVGL
jgi:hypothetical protein